MQNVPIINNLGVTGQSNSTLKNSFKKTSGIDLIYSQTILTQ